MTSSGGDNISNISGSIVTSNSTVAGSINNQARTGNVEQDNAIKQLGEMVAESGNEEAGELYEALTEELKKPEPKKSLMRTYWNGLKTALPLVASAATITTVLEKLVGA